MTPDLLQCLRANSAAIHVKWETLLRMEPVSGPLANPDALHRIIPETVAKILLSLAQTGGDRVSLLEEKSDRLPACDCGNNPYLTYYVAGERAFVEMAVLQQAKLPRGTRSESDIAELIRTVRALARTEIDLFCGICTHHGKAKHCRHAEGAH
jgi:hypothetical protein